MHGAVKMDWINITRLNSTYSNTFLVSMALLLRQLIKCTLCFTYKKTNVWANLSNIVWISLCTAVWEGQRHSAFTSNVCKYNLKQLSGLDNGSNMCSNFWMVTSQMQISIFSFVLVNSTSHIKQVTVFFVWPYHDNKVSFKTETSNFTEAYWSPTVLSKYNSWYRSTQW